ncbi:hypothetical protein SAMN05421788_107178 [Filimonas lacunae]|uniref:Right handed beta helix region n=1 Tax=Filimonas lacunae TaxID=477680 RepID=A0A173MFV9_9BACT|nr:hypothetical protein [Filimonas lacunae]BAV06514.1 hypothetical protein FLA_2533 [Filimonas lacunae]SIT27230.1 hypothetical protein SAMN05421788_107178 [Filimonas lacunae]
MKSIYIAIAFGMLLTACHKEETANVSLGEITAGQGITSDTLKASVKGTLLSGKTYYFSADITINQGDTLLMQPGSKLIALGDGKLPETSPQITCNGTFISLGTADNNNFITVLDSLRTTANIAKGYWGGIQCGANSGDVIIKWTHLEFAGGPAGANADPAVFTSGDPRNLLTYTNIDGNCIVEDSWMYGSTDDGIRILHGKVSFMRNTFEACGKTGGEALNLKSGTIGDVGYNLVIGAATNGFKVSNSGGTTVQTNAYLYNNTILNCGMRQSKSGRGGSINYEKGAQGKIYNNAVINCRYGLRITSDADTAHSTYNNQFYYSNASSQIAQFNCTDGVAYTKSGDVKSTAVKTNNPQFANYDVDQFDFSTATPPMTLAAMPITIITAQAYNWSMLPASPGLRKGNADAFKAMKVVPQGGLYGADIKEPGVDMGAYQSDGTGNLHYVSSLSKK